MGMFCALLIAGVSTIGSAADGSSTRLPSATPADVGLDGAKLSEIDAVVREGIDQGRFPGAVVLVVRQGKLAFRKAYGMRQKVPTEAPMSVDTVFDLASLTKPIATATSVMILMEQGKLRSSDRVARYFPEFAQHGKDQLTIEQLLLHVSGIVADNPVSDYDDGKKKALERIAALKPVAAPGSRFIYSDVNYIVLGELVERISGEPLDVFARKHVFDPLGMKETTFKPTAALAARAAPTEEREGRWMRGEVHDPRAFRLGGVAGHAGLFSKADDLAVYAEMLFEGGAFGGHRILSADSVKRMTTPRAVPRGLRAYGWDVQTAYSSNRGDLFPIGSFGHTGFTGTSIWIDPGSRTAVIVLTNRVHPNGKGDVKRLRGRIATIVAASIISAPFPGGGTEPRSVSKPGAAVSVLTGIDVLQRDRFRTLKGRRIGLVTNHTGVNRDGVSTIDLLHKADGVKLVALFSPEHGIRGALDEPVGDSTDAKTGLPAYSLYGKRRRPTTEQLAGIDTLVYDIQDIGCRFYTYLTTLGYILETGAANHLKVIVLDRPNPIGGLAVEGPILDSKSESFTGYHPLPVRHGMTLGELARLFNEERHIHADLEVVRMEGWHRADLFDRTGLLWKNPSPNMRSLAAALLYPGIGMLETTNVSVGRGTDRPFELVGAPWLDGRRLATELATMNLLGVRFVPTRFTPTSSTHAGKECGGVQIYIDDWNQFISVDTGIAVAYQIRRLYPTKWQTTRYLALLANAKTHEGLLQGATPARLRAGWEPDLKSFLRVRAKYLIYD